MSTPIKMPQLGESVIDGTISQWLKAPGEAVDKLEPLLEISTDKIDTEVPAPVSGVLLDILVPEGTTVTAGTILAYVGQAGEMLPEPVAPAEEPATSTAEASASRPPAVPPDRPAGRAFVSPVVSRMATEHGIDLEQVAGSGMGGRVTKKDILAHVEAQQAAEDIDIESGDSRVELDGLGQSPFSSRQSPEDEVLQPLTAMRRIIADHMVSSVQTSPHVTTIFEVDMTEVVLHRDRHKNTFAAKGVQLTFTPYFMAAVVAGLKAAPVANARFTPEGIVLNRRLHVGVAVALPDGLVVPVLRDADERNLQGLARAVNELAEQARAGTLSPDALQGGTFTITNHGVSGSLLGTPIINQPQSGILGVGAIVKRPVVRSGSASLLPSADDAIVIRPMCYLSYSFDHRVLDGAQADAFVSAIKERLENWEET